MGLFSSVSSPPPSPGADPSMAGFAKQGQAISQEGVDVSTSSSDAMMAQMAAINAQQMKTQTETAIMSMITNINNALAKVIKGMGSAIKELAGG